MEETTLLKLDKVDICREENVILHRASFTLHNGEFVYVIGKVGSGKSSLLKSLYCEIPINQGDAWLLDYNLCKMRRKDIPYLRRKLGIVFQDFQLLTDRSVHKNLEFVLKATGWKKKSEINERINNVLFQVGMQDKGYKMPHELSVVNIQMAIYHFNNGTDDLWNIVPYLTLKILPVFLHLYWLSLHL